MQQRSPTLLIILDGFGISKDLKHNAISAAHTPQWDEWWQQYPHTLVDASGPVVGLPPKQMGNSEVGHMHIGAGRTILQNYTFINNAITDGSLAKNEILLNTINNLKKNKKALHIMGLLSSGGVHSHQNHLFAILKICAENNLSNVYLHLFLDGRDTPPQSATASLSKLNKIINKYQVGKIATITGRYFAMDRDKRWDRVQVVYDLLTTGKRNYTYPSAESALLDFYANETFDEFIPPTKINSSPEIKDEDAILFFNFRADRARELTEAFISLDFSGFKRNKILKSITFLTMTQYSAHLNSQVIFPPTQLQNTVGEILSKHNLTQLRIAETEKYAHVTFFFNGGREVKFTNEDRILIQSPKVATYDLQPEMSAITLTDTLISEISKDKYDIIICNYANADMVGHTGNYPATIKAIETIDKCLKRLGDAVLAKNGQLLITADHGNAECMFDDTTKQPHTAHTSELVPLLYVGNKKLKFKSINATLSDIAPTLLNLLNIPVPNEMTGQILWDNQQ